VGIGLGAGAVVGSLLVLYTLPELGLVVAHAARILGATAVGVGTVLEHLPASVTFGVTFGLGIGAVFGLSQVAWLVRTAQPAYAK
jgi:hypothetical protein